MVFWLGLRGVPSASLGAILAALTSPSLSQFDSWWDGSRPEECVCTAEAIYIASEFIFVTPLPRFCSVLLHYLLHIYLPVTSQLLYFCLIIHLGCNSQSLGAAPSSFLLGSTFLPRRCFNATGLLFQSNREVESVSSQNIDVNVAPLIHQQPPGIICMVGRFWTYFGYIGNDNGTRPAIIPTEHLNDRHVRCSE